MGSNLHFLVMASREQDSFAEALSVALSFPKLVSLMTEAAVSSLDDVTCTALRSFRGEEFVVHLSHHSSEGSAGAVRVACERVRDSTLWSADFSASCACSCSVACLREMADCGTP